MRRAFVFAASVVLGAVGCTSSADPGDVGQSADSLEEGRRWKVLDVQYQAQSTGYWCGPAATRIALSARMNPPSQQALANQLPTTVNGTDTIDQVRRTLNANLDGDPYETKLLALPSQNSRSSGTPRSRRMLRMR